MYRIIRKFIGIDLSIFTFRSIVIHFLPPEVIMQYSTRFLSIQFITMLEPTFLVTCRTANMWHTTYYVGILISMNLYFCKILEQHQRPSFQIVYKPAAIREVQCIRNFTLNVLSQTGMLYRLT